MTGLFCNQRLGCQGSSLHILYICRVHAFMHPATYMGMIDSGIARQKNIMSVYEVHCRVIGLVGSVCLR